MMRKIIHYHYRWLHISLLMLLMISIAYEIDIGPHLMMLDHLQKEANYWHARPTHVNDYSSENNHLTSSSTEMISQLTLFANTSGVTLKTLEMFYAQSNRHADIAVHVVIQGSFSSIYQFLKTLSNHIALQVIKFSYQRMENGALLFEATLRLSNLLFYPLTSQAILLDPFCIMLASADRPHAVHLATNNKLKTIPFASLSMAGYLQQKAQVLGLIRTQDTTLPVKIGDVITQEHGVVISIDSRSMTIAFPDHSQKKLFL